MGTMRRTAYDRDEERFVKAAQKLLDNYSSINFDDLTDILKDRCDENEPESEADVLNAIEKKAREGKATKQELNLLVEGYNMHNVKIPKFIMRQLI